jgi:hypothetical protein
MVKMPMPDNFFLGILTFRNSLATFPAATILLHLSCEQFVNSHDRSAYSAAGKYVDRSWDYKKSLTNT